jgi:hypothetical protein
MIMNPSELRTITTEIRDGENNPANYDFAYSVGGDNLLACLSAIRERHGAGFYLMPVSAASAGGGVFQHSAPSDGDVIALNIQATPAPIVHTGKYKSIRNVALDEIVIDQAHSEVIAGAAITLEQLNIALGDAISPQTRVMGADLTTYSYAQVGSTFMTGGMGPQRRYFSDSVTEIALYDGDKIIVVKGEELQGYAGTYGWSGIVTAVKCRYHSLPRNEIAFALPVNSSPDGLAQFLRHLWAKCFLDLEKEQVVTEDGGTDLILGLEHISVSSMGPLLSSGIHNESRERAQQLAGKCQAANADGVIFVSACSDGTVEEFLPSLVDDIDADSLTVGGIDLEHTELFKDPEQMRQLREAVPFAARHQPPAGEYRYKNHTDANIRLNPENIAASMRRLWEINADYVANVESCFRDTKELHGEILVYGHMNPYGVDPHNRVTLDCDHEGLFNSARERIVEYRAQYYRHIRDMCDQTGSILVGGEKSADSEQHILAALGGPDCAPGDLRRKFKHQRKTIRAASRIFNWRAMDLYY